MLLLLMACGGPGIPTEGYSTSCTTDEECHAVQVGDVCACGCEVIAIGEESLEDWMADRDFYYSTQCDQGDTCQCPEYTAVCGEVGCELR